MTNKGTRSYPREVAVAGGAFELRPMGTADAEAVLAFAATLPEHDLLFLRRDISQAKVVAAWLDEIEQGGITSLLALRDGVIVGCTALVRDPLSWSPHVAELRVVVGTDLRGQGLGRILAQDSFAIALELGIEKITAQMTVDQKGAIASLEEVGFKAEALLRDHVKDRAGQKHDLVILSHDVASFEGQIGAYGLDEALEG